MLHNLCFYLRLTMNCVTRLAFFFLLLVDHFLWCHSGFIPPELWVISLSAVTQSVMVPVKQAVRQTTCSQCGGIMAEVCVCVCSCGSAHRCVILCLCINMWSNSFWQPKSHRWNDERRQKTAGRRDGWRGGEACHHFGIICNFSWQVIHLIILNTYK